MTAGRAFALRITVGDTWQPVALVVSPDDRVGELKRRALAAAGLPADTADRYEVKAAGALVTDEERTVAGVGLGEGSALVILSRRRRPVR